MESKNSLMKGVRSAAHFAAERFESKEALCFDHLNDIAQQCVDGKWSARLIPVSKQALVYISSKLIEEFIEMTDLDCSSSMYRNGDENELTFQVSVYADHSDETMDEILDFLGAYWYFKMFNPFTVTRLRTSNITKEEFKLALQRWDERQIKRHRPNPIASIVRLYLGAFEALDDEWDELSIGLLVPPALDLTLDERLEYDKAYQEFRELRPSRVD